MKMLNWCKPFNIFCLLDNLQYRFQEPAFECLMAVGAKKDISASAGNAFGQLKQFSAEQKSWLFGHLSYDLKNETETLHSSNPDGIGFDDMYFFVPEIVLQLDQKGVTISCDTSAAEIFSAIEAGSPVISKPMNLTASVQNKISKEAYLQSVKKLQQHILRGDCYEINFCQEFFMEDVEIEPLAVYHQLTTLSPNPFSVLYKNNNRYCIGASPERYFKKTGSKIISQPIKGTSKRNHANALLDEESKNSLLNSEKEKSENVMVVDLVRNDLSRVCVAGSVKVEELFGIYSFPNVHQMISTVSGEVNENTDWVDIIKATFPMGSMTGAPKKKVMELIEEYEQTKRGLFSGSVGYVNPAGDADFNVVIRSILYNAETRYLSFQTGGAITFYSDAEKEYDECLLKATAIMQVLKGV